MRPQHSSRFLYALGWAAVGLGVLGLAGQTTTYLLADEDTSAESTLPVLAAPVIELAAGVEDEDAVSDDTAPITLVDVITGDVPELFSQSAIEELLPESWGEWGLEVSDLFIELYEDEPEAEDVDRILKRLRVKQNTLDRALADGKYSMIRNELTTLRGLMDRNLELVGAIQSALSSGRLTDPTAETNSLFSDLASRVVDARNDMNRVNTGAMWADYFRLETLAEIASLRNVSEDARQTLGFVGDRLTNLDAYSEDQAAFLKRPTLSRLAETLTALDDRLTEPTSARDATVERLQTLVQAVNQYEFNSEAEAAAALRSEVNRLSRFDSQLAGVLRSNYMANNFRATVSESLIRTLLSDSRAEQGIVNDCVFGTRVVGDQWIASDLSVDLIPSMSSAAFVLNLNGNVTTSTRGLAKQATVYTKGNHTFTANKRVNFDGYRFTSTAASVGVNANNRTYAARAKTKIPIVKGIIRNIALDRARELKPRSDALTRRKVSNQVSSRFDSEVLEMLGNAEGRLDSNLYSRLRTVGLYPERQSVSSSDTTLDLSARMLDGGELAASAPRTMPYPTSGLAAQIHESYLNNALDRMNFAGRTMTNEEVKEEFERFAEQATGRPVAMGSRSEVIENGDAIEQVGANDEDDLSDAAFIFDEDDPIRVRVGANQMTLIMKAGLQTTKETIAQQVIEIPLTLTLDGSDVVINRGTIAVKPVKRPKNRVRQIAQAGVVRAKIQQTLPERRIQGTFHLTLENKTVPLALRTLDIADGWISATVN